MCKVSIEIEHYLLEGMPEHYLGTLKSDEYGKMIVQGNSVAECLHQLSISYEVAVDHKNKQ